MGGMQCSPVVVAPPARRHAMGRRSGAAARRREAGRTGVCALVGVGPGAGISLLYVISGLIVAAIALSGYALPFIRNVEDILPDHEAVGGDVEEDIVAGEEPQTAEGVA